MTTNSDSSGKLGWNIDPKDLNTLRKFKAGIWSEPINVQVAQLDLLDKIENHLDRIRFRVGFLALMVLLSILASLFFLLSAISSLGNLG